MQISFSRFLCETSLISLRHRDGNRRYAFAAIASRACVFCAGVQRALAHGRAFRLPALRERTIHLPWPK